MVTTRELLWLDPRYMNRPLLGWEHQRTYDRTLKIQAPDIDRGNFFSKRAYFFSLLTSTLAPMVVLYSKKSPYRSVYSISERSPGLYGRALGPSALPKISDGSQGATYIRNPLDNSLHLLEMSADGSIDCLDILYERRGGPEKDNDLSNLDAIWSDDVRELDGRASRPEELSPLARRSFAEVNLRPLYERMLTFSWF